MKQIFIILYLALTYLCLQAEPHLTRNYANRYFSTRDGLAQMQVMCAFQDRDGYMWFGTKGGVSRFDGISFKNYLPENGFPSDQVHSIGEWGMIKVISTTRSIVLIHPNDTISVHSFPDKVLSLETRCNILPLDYNRLLVFNQYNEDKNPDSKSNRINYVFDLKANRFIPFKGFNELVVDVKGDTLLTKTGLFKRIGSKIKRLLRFPPEIEHLYLNARVDWKNNIFYFENTGDFLKYRLYAGKFIFIGKIAAKDGQHIKTALSDSTLLAMYSLTNPFFIQSKTVQLDAQITFPNYLYTDREKNLWVCTDNGLYNFFNLSIEEYKLNIGNPDNIWSVVEDNKHNMWFGSYGNGLWLLDPSGRLASSKEKYRNCELQYMGSLKAPTGDVYMTYVRGVARFVNGKLTGLSNTEGCLSMMYDDKNKQLVYSGVDSISNGRGLYIGFDKNKSFYLWDKGYPVCLARDAKGRIRVGGFRGQALFSGDSIITDTRRHEYKGVICMSSDNRGRLWKGTERGVFVEMPNEKEYRVSDSRLTGAIYSILVYHNKYLLVGGGHSLMIVDIRNLKSYSNLEMWDIGYDAGFTGLESGQNGFCEDHNGDIWLCTALNVLKFNPERLVKGLTQHIPPLRISNIAFSVDNINWDQHFFYKGKVQLDVRNKFLRIEYVANSISAPKSLRFKYRLVGFSDKWSESVSTKSANYTNIGYGKYHFEIQCSMDGICWSAVVVSPEIEIMTPWWAKPWIVIMYVLFFGALVALVTWLIVKGNQQKKLTELKRIKLENELQLNTLRSKVIPHFTKNVLSAIGYFAMTDKLKAGHYISLFSEFTHSTLTNADKNYIPLSDELNYIHNYLELEKMRFGDKFDYQMEIETEVSLEILIPTMTLHTYCDNAIRHGLVHKQGKGLLIISVAIKEGGTLLTILDNGVGRKKAEELGTRGNGQGLSIIQAQLDFYNSMNKTKIIQTITEIETNESNGTKVELFIPTGFMFEKIN